jgi:GNAT superfamily N-acetyltransferase
MSSDMTVLAATADLLNDVFAPDPPLQPGELSWYYDENPEGRAAVGRVVDRGRQLGNYALVPLRFEEAEGSTVRLGLGVDLAVHPDARGSGAFRRTVENSYEEGRSAGLDGILGIANLESAPRMVEAMGWRQLDPLPLRLLLPTPWSGRHEHHAVTEDLLASGRLDEWLPDRSRAGDTGYAATWSAEQLRWRLGRRRADYVLHVLDDAILVSTRARMAGVRFAVLLKVIPRRPLEVTLAGGPLAAVVGEHHRTPFVVHWGRNHDVRFRYLSLLRRFMPSPLEIVLFSFHDDFDAAVFELCCFEFLDFDAF